MIRYTLPNFKEENTRKLLDYLRLDGQIEIVLPIMEDPERFDVPEFLRTFNILVVGEKISAVYFNDYVTTIDSYALYGVIQIASHKNIQYYDLKTGENIRSYLVAKANGTFRSQLRSGTIYRNTYNWFDSVGVTHENGSMTPFYSYGYTKKEMVPWSRSVLSYDIYNILGVENIVEFPSGLNPLTEREYGLLGNFAKDFKIYSEDNYYYCKATNGRTYLVDGFKQLLLMSRIYKNLMYIGGCICESIYNSSTWGCREGKGFFSVGVKISGDPKNPSMLIYVQDFGRGIGKIFGERSYHMKTYGPDETSLFEKALEKGGTISSDFLEQRGLGLDRIHTSVRKLEGSLEILSGNIHYIMDNKLEYNDVGVDRSGTLIKIEFKI